MCMLDLLNCFLFYTFVVLLKLSKKEKIKKQLTLSNIFDILLMHL